MIILDGVVILQQLVSIQLTSFVHVAEFSFKRILTRKVVYFVTDQYKPGSIKSLERERRKTSIMRCESGLKKGNKCDRSDERNTWEIIRINRSLLNSCWRIGHNQCAMLTYLLLPLFFFFFFFNCGSQFSKLSLKDGLTEWLSTLVRDQEETETKLFLCTKHAEVLEVLADITIYALYCALQILHSFLYISRLVQVTGGIA